VKPNSRSGTRAHWARVGGKALLQIVLLAGVLVVMFPFIWMLVSSFKSLTEVISRPTDPGLSGILSMFAPQQWLLGNYQQAWYVGIIDTNVTVWPEHVAQIGPLAIKWYDVPSTVPWYATIMARYFVNTIFVAVAVLVGVLTTSVLAAYAFARMEFFGKNTIFLLFLATMMIPFEVTMIPNFVIIRNIPFNTPPLPIFGYDLFGMPDKAGWYNTYAAQIVPWLASVFTIFMLRQFFMGIPQDFYDAARIDGCGHLRYLVQIVLPLSRPALVTGGLMTFLGSWNSLLWPILVTGKADLRPIQVGLSYFLAQEGSDYHLLMAAATMTILPIAILYFIGQRYFIEGIASSGVKG
jgi:multiple sugar transport system permease protein